MLSSMLIKFWRSGIQQWKRATTRALLFLSQVKRKGQSQEALSSSRLSEIISLMQPSQKIFQVRLHFLLCDLQSVAAFSNGQWVRKSKFVVDY